MAERLAEKATIEGLREENARLEAEVARLQTLATLSAQPAVSKPRITSEILRKAMVIVCIVFAVLLAVFGNLFFWAANTLVDQDRFVAATAPVIRDTKVQQTMALYATNQIFAAVNVQQLVTQALPPRASFLAPQLAGQVRGFTESSLQKTLASQKLQQTWNTVVAKQHENFIQYAKHYQGNGTVSLNDVFQQLTSRVSNTKLSFLQGKQLPKNIGSITVVTASWLPMLHTLVTNIGVWRTLSILGLVVFVALAIWLSRKKRHTIFYLSLFSILGLATSLIALRAIREQLVDKVQPSYRAGVASAIQILGHGLLVQTATIIIAIVILGFITWISGGSPSAASVKRFTQSLFTGKLHGVLFAQENRITSWVGSHRKSLEWITVGVFIALMLSLQLTIKTLILLVVLLLIAVLGIEIVGNQARRVPDQRV